MKSLVSLLRRIKYAKYNIDLGRSIVNLPRALPLYTPSSFGKYSDIAQLTLANAQNIFPALVHYLELQYPNKLKQAVSIRDYIALSADSHISTLANLFNHYGSDKASVHDYHILYAYLLPPSPVTRYILEIGLGSNNIDVVSTMGASGSPGSSLRAFRDLDSKHIVYGADIDERILFQDERIATAYVDQLKPETFLQLDKRFPSPTYDLIIDDGLHSPLANLNTLVFALSRISPGGSIVIEDIAPDSVPFWQLIALTLDPSRWDATIIKSKTAFLFLVTSI